MITDEQTVTPAEEVVEETIETTTEVIEETVETKEVNDTLVSPAEEVKAEE